MCLTPAPGHIHNKSSTKTLKKEEKKNIYIKKKGHHVDRCSYVSLADQSPRPCPTPYGCLPAMTMCLRCQLTRRYMNI
ncbi:hypothetical protein GYH30_008679 [Glycine max]|uniref:Uncharacterized protein n=1 Tax=Glycine max TaxID=3847 RepID=A0A0R0K8N6_SOYBN|nr:hypothetical protein GYH30_008679 [Glycine max]